MVSEIEIEVRDIVYLPNAADETVIKAILARGETAVVVEAGDTVEILGVANYPRVCREYYLGRLVVAVFRTQGDLEARLLLAKAKAANSTPRSVRAI